MSMAAPHVNRFLTPTHQRQAWGRRDRKYSFVRVLWSLLKPKQPHLGTTVNLLHGFDSWLVPRMIFTSLCLFDLPKASIMLANSV